MSDDAPTHYVPEEEFDRFDAEIDTFGYGSDEVTAPITLCGESLRDVEWQAPRSEFLLLAAGRSLPHTNEPCEECVEKFKERL